MLHKHKEKNRLQYQRNHCSFKSSSLVQWNTPGLHCSHPPAPCALWDLTTPETAWRQRGSWEWEDEVTNRRWGREDGGREGSLSLSLFLCSVILHSVNPNSAPSVLTECVTQEDTHKHTYCDLKCIVWDFFLLPGSLFYLCWNLRSNTNLTEEKNTNTTLLKINIKSRLNHELENLFFHWNGPLSRLFSI